MKNRLSALALVVSLALVLATPLSSQVSVFVGRLGLGTLVQVGSGTATARPCGTVTTNATSATTPANTTETDLWSYTLPANTLTENGHALHIVAFGSFAANANGKTVRLYYGGTVISTHNSTSNGGGWYLRGTVMRTGASAQIAFGDAYGSAGTLVTTFAAPAASTTATTIIKATGQNGALSADITFRGAIVECTGNPL